MTNEAAPEDVRHLREWRAGGGLQGREDPVPFPERAREDAAEPSLGYLRPPPATAQHGHQARPSAGPAAVHQGLRRLTPPRPAGWGQALALAGYLLFAPPVFVFGPLAGLLLLSRPASVREWFWLLGGAAWSVVWLQQVGGLGAQVTRAGAVLLC